MKQSGVPHLHLDTTDLSPPIVADQVVSWMDPHLRDTHGIEVFDLTQGYLWYSDDNEDVRERSTSAVTVSVTASDGSRTEQSVHVLEQSPEEYS